MVIQMKNNETNVARLFATLMLDCFIIMHGSLLVAIKKRGWMGEELSILGILFMIYGMIGIALALIARKHSSLLTSSMIHSCIGCFGLPAVWLYLFRFLFDFSGEHTWFGYGLLILLIIATISFGALGIRLLQQLHRLSLQNNGRIGKHNKSVARDG